MRQTLTETGVQNESLATERIKATFLQRVLSQYQLLDRSRLAPQQRQITKSGSLVKLASQKILHKDKFHSVSIRSSYDKVKFVRTDSCVEGSKKRL